MRQRIDERGVRDQPGSVDALREVRVVRKTHVPTDGDDDPVPQDDRRVLDDARASGIAEKSRRVLDDPVVGSRRRRDARDDDRENQNAELHLWHSSMDDATARER